MMLSEQIQEMILSWKKRKQEPQSRLKPVPGTGKMKGYKQVKTYILSSVIFILLGLTGALSAQVSGVVFQDFNSNGVRDNDNPDEPGIEGISVMAYGMSGTDYGPVATAADGTYTLAGISEPARIEFTWTETWLHPSASGGTRVQFVSGAATNIDLGVLYPENFCNPDTAEVEVIVTCFVNGDPLSSTGSAPFASAGSAIASQAYGVNGGPTNVNDANSISPAPNDIATAAEVGAVWGLAWQREEQRLFSSAFVRRHVGLGNLGPGGIYVTDMSGPMPSTQAFVDVTALGLDVGTISDNTGRGLSGSVGSASNDPEAYDGVGTIGIGDIDISDDGSTLYFVNLNTKLVHGLVIDSDDNPLTAPTAADLITFASPPVTCTNGNYRPFALTYHKGKIYLGGVCDGDDGTYSNDPNDADNLNLFAYVHELDPASPATTPLEVLEFQLYSDDFPPDANDYPHTGLSGGNCGFVTRNWHPWRTGTYPPHFTSSGSCNSVYQWPTPMLSNIEFDHENSMILAIADRVGFQLGNDNYGLTGTTANSVHAGGDILRAYPSGVASWTLEAGGDKDGPGPYTPTANQINNSEGPGGGEFYWGDRTPGFHLENSLGALAVYPGQDEVVYAAVDPPLTIFSNGLSYLSNSTGNIEYNSIGYPFFYNPGGNGREGFSKAAGLGDVELTCSSAPVEIGNLVWNDTNTNGVQDPGETGIANVTVELLNAGGTVIATAVTDGSGNYIFSNAAATNTSSNIYNLSLNFGDSYTLRVPNAQGAGQQTAVSSMFVTAQNTDNSSNGDSRDADGSIADNSEISLTLGRAGENNHTYDFGFSSTAPPEPNLCDCTEYLYLNDVALGEVHKFAVDPVTGDISEIGSPWMSGFNNPHGIAADLNGNLYIGDDPQGPIYVLDSEGGTVTNDATVWNSTVGQGLTNMGSIDNYIFANGGFNMINEERERIQVLDACTGDRLGSICLEGATGLDWGMQVLDDGTILYSEGIDVGIGFVPTRSIWKFDFDPSLINNTPNCIPKLQDGGYLNNYSELYGITTDGTHLYSVARKTGGGTFIVKSLASDGSFVAELEEATMPGTDANNPGFAGARGIIYAPSSGMLYVAGIEDCISIVRASDLTYIGAGAGIVNQVVSEPKAIGILKECCPNPASQVVDISLCTESVGQQVFLQELLSCEGIIAEGAWTETQNTSNGGIVFEQCDLSIMVNSSGCATYTLEKTTPATGVQQCNEFDLVVNICSQIPSATLTPGQGTCAGLNPNNDAVIALSAVMNGDEAGVVAGMDYTGGPVYGSSTIDVSSGTGTFMNLMHNTQYTVRVFNGTNDCFTDYTVTTPVIDCTNPCIAPTFTAVGAAGSCNGATANNDALINLSSIVNGDEANFSPGASYSGAAYGDGSNVNVSGGSGSFTGLTHNTQYTVRVFNGNNTCFTDETITTPNISCAVTTYSLGNRVFYDDDISGDQNGTENGVDGIVLQLLNADGSVYDSDPGNPGIQALTVTTANGGYYRFDDLPAGNYIVEVTASAFTGGGILENYASSDGANQENNPNNDIDSNDNGLDVTVAGAVRSGLITLGGTEPTGEEEPGTYAAGSFTGTAAADTESNLTVDFGFYRQRDRPDCCDNPENPCTDEPCHFISNDIYFGSGVTSDASSNPSPTADTDADDGLIWTDNVNAAPGGVLNVPVVIYNNTGSDAYFRLWIDWNDDGDFDDSGEQVADELYLSAVYNGTFQIYHQVSIPVAAVRNQDLALRMRLSTDDTNSTGPCGTATCAADGEIEDYLLRVSCVSPVCLPVTLQRD